MRHLGAVVYCKDGQMGLQRNYCWTWILFKLKFYIFGVTKNVSWLTIFLLCFQQSNGIYTFFYGMNSISQIFTRSICTRFETLAPTPRYSELRPLLCPSSSEPSEGRTSALTHSQTGSKKTRYAAISICLAELKFPYSCNILYWQRHVRIIFESTQGREIEKIPNFIILIYSK